MNQEVLIAIEQICNEKNLPKEVVIDALEQALAASYKKDFGDKFANYQAKLDFKTGKIKLWRVYQVVEEVEDPEIELSLSSAKEKDSSLDLGAIYSVEIAEEHLGSDFGRVAAQTAKQVILQKLREAERSIVVNAYKDKVGSTISAVVSRVERGNVIVDLGKGLAIMPKENQISSERYYPGMRLKVLILEADPELRNYQIVVSRSHPELISSLFEMEVPEVQTKVVQIKAIAREAGLRTKIAVATSDESIDPIGTFVGGRGSRVQAVMNEIGEEKIDIVEYSDDPAEFITNALSPAEINSIELDLDKKEAIVRVDEQNKSLAIGKLGQNVRLSSQLTGWKLEIALDGQE